MLALYSSPSKFALALALLLSLSLPYGNNQNIGLLFVDADRVNALELKPVFRDQEAYNVLNGILYGLGGMGLSVAASVKDSQDKLVCKSTGSGGPKMQKANLQSGFLVRIPCGSERWGADHQKLIGRLSQGHGEFTFLKGKEQKAIYSGDFSEPNYNSETRVIRVQVEI